MGFHTTLQSWKEARVIDTWRRRLKTAAAKNAPLETGVLNAALLKYLMKGYMRVADFLLHNGASPDAMLSYDYAGARYYPLVVEMARHNRAEELDLLIRHGADLEKAESHAGITALITAAAQGHTRVVEKLLAAGCNIETNTRTYICGVDLFIGCNIGGCNARYYADFYGHDDIVKQLEAEPKRRWIEAEKKKAEELIRQAQEKLQKKWQENNPQVLHKDVVAPPAITFKGKKA